MTVSQETRRPTPHRYRSAAVVQRGVVKSRTNTGALQIAGDDGEIYWIAPRHANEQAEAGATGEVRQYQGVAQGVYTFMPDSVVEPAAGEILDLAEASLALNREREGSVKAFREMVTLETVEGTPVVEAAPASEAVDQPGEVEVEVENAVSLPEPLQPSELRDVETLPASPRTVEALIEEVSRELASTGLDLDLLVPKLHRIPEDERESLLPEGQETWPPKEELLGAIRVVEPAVPSEEASEPVAPPAVEPRAQTSEVAQGTSEPEVQPGVLSTPVIPALLGLDASALSGTMNARALFRFLHLQAETTLALVIFLQSVVIPEETNGG